MRALVVAAMLLGSVQAAQSQNIPVNSMEALKLCLWGQTYTQGGQLARDLAMGYNVAARIGGYCARLSGAQMWCERNGGSIYKCADFILHEANLAIEEELRRTN